MNNINGEKRIMLVDDHPENLHTLKSVLEANGYKAYGAINGQLALEAVSQVKPDLILLDIIMPGMDGYEVCSRLKSDKDTKDIPILFISALHEPLDKLKAFELGAVDYVTKPFQPEEVLARVRTHVSLHRMKTHLEQIVVDRVNDMLEIREKYHRLESNLAKIIAEVVFAWNRRDPILTFHLQRVANMATAIARQMGLSKEKIEGIRVAAVLHDIGRLDPSSELYRINEQNGRSDTNNNEHSKVGFDIFKGIDMPWPIAEIIYQHHEFMDGSGFPRGLKGDEILMEARIIGIANVLESILSTLALQGNIDTAKALEEIKKNRGTLYDPEIVDACIEMFEQNGVEEVFTRDLSSVD